MTLKPRKRFFISWTNPTPYFPFSSKFSGLAKNPLIPNFFEISKKHLTCVNYNLFRILFVRKDTMYFEFARKAGITAGQRPGFARDWFYIKKLLRSKRFFSSYFLHLSFCFQQNLLKLPPDKRSICSVSSWHNFSRDLASYSLLSLKKKYRRLFLKKNFLRYADVRLKFKYDLITLLSTKIVSPRWRFRSLLFQKNVFYYQRMLKQKKLLQRFSYKFLFSFVFRTLDKKIKNQAKKNRLLRFFITHVKFKTAKARAEFRSLNRPLLVWFRKIFKRDVEKVLHRGISLRKFKVLPELDRTRENTWWQRPQITYPIHKGRIKRHFSYEQARRLKNLYWKIRRTRTLPQRILLRGVVIKPTLLKWLRNLKNLSLNPLLYGYVKRNPQIYIPRKEHSRRSHQILPTTNFVFSYVRYPSNLFSVRVLTKQKRLFLSNKNFTKVGYLTKQNQKKIIKPWLFYRFQKSHDLLRPIKVFDDWLLRRNRKKTKLWKISKVTSKNFFTTSNHKQKFAQFSKPQTINKLGLAKCNLETRNVFSDAKMTSKKLKPFKSSKRFVSHRYNLVKVTKNLVFLSKLWLDALRLFVTVKTLPAWNSVIIFQIQYYINLLCHIDQTCKYPYSFVHDNVTMLSSDKDLNELVLVFEHVLCFFSFAFIKVLPFQNNLPLDLKPIKFDRYRPNKKAQHLVDLNNEFYLSKSFKTRLVHKRFFVSPGLKKLFKILTQNSYFHKPTSGTPLLLRKNQVLTRTPFPDRIRYLFHRVHNIDIRKYSKIRFETPAAKFVLSNVVSSTSNLAKQPSIASGAYITLPFDSSISHNKMYHPWMTLIDRKKKWSKFLRVPRTLQDFRYYKDRLIPPTTKKILLIVEPYNDLIFYVNLKSIKFVEFTFSASFYDSLHFCPSTYYVNKKLRLKRTHFFRLGLGRTSLPAGDHEYFFAKQVPVASFPRKRFVDERQKINPKILLIDNLENRLTFWKTKLFISHRRVPEVVKKRPFKIGRIFFRGKNAIASFFTRAYSLKILFDTSISKPPQSNLDKLTQRLSRLKTTRRRRIVKFFSCDLQSFKWKFFNRKWYQMYSKWKRSQAFRPLIKQAWSSYRKLSKNFLFIKLFKVHLNHAFGLSDTALWVLWRSVRRGNNLGVGSFVEQFAMALHLKLDGLVLFLGLAPSRPIAQELVSCGALRINGFVLTNYNWMLRLQDVIQVDLHVWQNVKSLFPMSHWDKIKYRLKFFSFLYPCWPIMLFVFMKWPHRHELVEESMMTERWIRYYIRYFPIKVAKYRRPKIEWLKY